MKQAKIEPILKLGKNQCRDIAEQVAGVSLASCSTIHPAMSNAMSLTRLSEDSLLKL